MTLHPTNLFHSTIYARLPVISLPIARENQNMNKNKFSLTVENYEMYLSAKYCSFMTSHKKVTPQSKICIDVAKVLPF